MDAGPSAATMVGRARSPLDFTLGYPLGKIPAQTLRMAGFLLLDTLGVCIAAGPLEAGRLARDMAVRFHATHDPACRATVLFDGRSASRPGMTFAAATQIDNLDAHDGYNPTKGHIGVAAVPALIAEAEALPRLSAVDALAALIVGCEIAGRAGKRWSRNFGPLFKVDRMTKVMIQNEETKDPFARV